MKTQRRVLRLIGILLALIMSVQMIPVSAIEEGKKLFSEAEKQEETTPETGEEAFVLGEVEEKREAAVKHFRMSDGSFLAASYPNLVHYKTDGGYKEIDNTLKLESDGRYENTDSPFEVSFGKDRSDLKLVSVEQDGYKVSFGLVSAQKVKTVTGQSEMLTLKGMQSIEVNLQKVIENRDGISKDIAGTQTKMMEREELPESTPEEVKQKMITAKRNAAGIEYHRPMPGVSLEYAVSGMSVKEYIILDSMDAGNEFPFFYETGDLLARLNEGGEIEFYDESTKEVIFKSPAGFMADAEGKYSDKVEYTLQKVGRGYLVTVTADKEWLSDKERKFPVKVDPVLQSSQNMTTIQDTFSNPKSAGTSGGGHWFYAVGRYSASDINTGWIQFRGMPSLGAGDVVTNAYLNMYLPAKAEVYSNGSYLAGYHGSPQNRVIAKMVTSAWTEGGLTHNNKPSVENMVLDYVDTSTVNRFYTMNITRAVDSWYRDGNPNNDHGIQLTTDQGNTSKLLRFYSAQSPNYAGAGSIIQVEYRNTVGLEDYYSYHAMPLENAGTAYINDFTGALTYAHQGITREHEKLPITLFPVYNSVPNAGNKTTYGNLWKWNIQQHLFPTGITGYPWKWTDADGTAHYFTTIDGKLQDEDGLGMTLTIGGNGGNNVITDKSGMKYSFLNGGPLQYIIDTNGNQVQIGYDGWRIIWVIDGTWQQYNFNYDSGMNKLISVSSPDGRDIQMTYDGSGNLTKITNPDGTATSFQYSGTKMIRVAAAHESRLDFSFYPNGKYENANKYGNSQNSSLKYGYHFRYSYLKTVVTENQRAGSTQTPDQTTYVFNTWGNTVSAYDNMGSAVGSTVHNGQNTKLNYHVMTSGGTLQEPQNLVMNYKFQNNAELWNKNILGQVSYDTSNKKVTFDHQGVQGRSYLYTSSEMGGAYPGKTYTYSAKCSSGVHLSLGIDNSATGVRRYQEGRPDGSGIASTTVTLGANERIGYIELMYTGSGTGYAEKLELTEGGKRWELKNLLLDGGHEGGRYWTPGDAGTEYSRDYVHMNVGDSVRTGFIAMRQYGYAERNNFIYQNLSVSGQAGDTYMFGGWGWARSVVRQNDRNNRIFGISLTFWNNDGTSTVEYAPFTAALWDEWQYLSKPAVAAKSHHTVQIRLHYAFNQNTSYFDGLFVHKDGAQSYTYDSNGNVISTVENGKNQTNFTYDGAQDLKSLVTPTGSNFTYNYDAKKNLTSAQSSEGVKYEMTYDRWGNPTGSKTSAVSNSSLKMESTATYWYDGTYLQSITDSRGNRTEYSGSSPVGKLRDVTDAKGNVVSNTYNARNGRTIATTSSFTQYGSTERIQSSILYNIYSPGLLRTLTSPGATYLFGYDHLWNTVSVWVGSQNLISHEYQPSTGNLTKSTYGNGQTVHYEYDRYDRLIGKWYDGNTSQKTTYTYNSRHQLEKMMDGQTGKTYEYKYDFNGTLIETKTSDLTSSYVYDTFNRMTGLTQRVGNSTRSTEVVYGTGNQLKNTVVGMKLNGTQLLSYNYDALMRQTSRVLNSAGNFTTSYSYLPGVNGNTTTLIETMQVGSDSFHYTYDVLGNITQIKKNNVLQARDDYNELGWLRREDKVVTGKTTVYLYDVAGNITEVKEYAYTLSDTLGAVTNSSVYGYSNQDWKDLLTEYNGTQLTYDQIGNPLQYRDGMNFSWSSGRRLMGITGLLTDPITYTYDDGGIRTGKTVNGVTTSYVLDGTTILREIKGSNTVLDYYYDDGGNLFALDYNGVRYYYARNLQNDIIGILDSTGAYVVQYTYDTWGNVQSISGTLAATLGTDNPFRYRGYYYDAETGFYYLQSRYYDPQTKRFLNADGQFDEGAGLSGANLFQYCGNNPVSYVDYDGQSLLAIIGGGLAALAATNPLAAAVIVVGVAVATAVVTYGLIEVARSIPMPRLRLPTIRIPKIVPAKPVEEPVTGSKPDVIIRTAPRNPLDAPYHMHHIVAQNAPQAAPAQWILGMVYIDRHKDPQNLVSLSMDFHLKITHGSMREYYYNMVNNIIVSAYDRAGPSFEEKESAVYRALDIISWSLQASDRAYGVYWW